jgi:predicted nucleic acid-binding protein
LKQYPTKNVNERLSSLFLNRWVTAPFIKKTHFAVQPMGSTSMDITFVALSLFLDIKLWTGDKLLISGLTKKGFKNIITTQEILQLRREI